MPLLLPSILHLLVCDKVPNQVSFYVYLLHPVIVYQLVKEAIKKSDKSYCFLGVRISKVLQGIGNKTTENLDL